MRRDFPVAMEDVHHIATSLHLDPLADEEEGHQGLTPINLTLLPRWGLKPEQGPVRLPLDFAQGGHTPLHGLVTAGIAAARPQLLIQNPRRVPDLWGAGLHKVGMGGQQGLHYCRPAIGLPCRLPQTAAHCLAIQIQAPPDF